jgi:predicted acylesterase/phospholipase RssA
LHSARRQSATPVASSATRRSEGRTASSGHSRRSSKGFAGTRAWRAARDVDFQLHVRRDVPFCISSNLEGGTLNVHEEGSVAEAVLAGAALPGILPPRVYERRLVVDGAVLNALPVDVMRQRPVGEVIAVDLSSRKSYRLDFDALPSPWAALRASLLPNWRTGGFSRRLGAPRAGAGSIRADAPIVSAKVVDRESVRDHVQDVVDDDQQPR